MWESGGGTSVSAHACGMCACVCIYIIKYMHTCMQVMYIYICVYLHLN